jgi:hypothetical protein
MERFAILRGTKSGENGIPPTGSTEKAVPVSYFIKKRWTTLIRVKMKQIKALSQPLNRGLITETKEHSRQHAAYVSRFRNSGNVRNVGGTH